MQQKMEFIRQILRLYIISNTIREITTIHPVIIFPGLASNTIWHDPDPEECFQHPRLWYSAASGFFVNQCWAEMIKLRFNASTNQVEDTTKIKFWPDFGKLSTIEDIGENKYLNTTQLYNKMIDRLVKKGLRRDHSIRAVPMDWRRAVTDFSDTYYEDVRKELRSSHTVTGDKATLICHSYGCVNLAYFISKSEPNEINGYIHRIITLGAPWKGSTKALKALLIGDTLDVKFNLAYRLRPVLKTFTSLIHLIPDADILEDLHPFITIDGNTRTVPDVLKKFDINPKILVGRDNITSIMYSLGGLDTENIKIYCLYGKTAVPTVLSKLKYKSNRMRWKQNRNGEGDGTVPLMSLQACVNKTFIAKDKAFDVKHQDMLSDERVLNYIMRNID